MKLQRLKADEAFVKIQLCKANSLDSRNDMLTENALQFCVKNWRKNLGTVMRDKKKKIIGKITEVVYNPTEKAMYAFAIVKKCKLKNVQENLVTFIEK